ncbi:prephenate dehydrogenase/arogenate dehydrogenase family protein [Natronomonas sp. F2-12]|jgi:prephenate dehydrogenase|uniref:Prephenate dehydrogenase/arogenate dehydrogenase family protein n=1 Tax=Natronomonas aquatica TaxID=2841590 RepID=A0A9R1CTN6_9EURY|nr:prephenate dehydrogenase/arogenate dehydrogenase family protein [Natronomonas aquatica]MCQ4333376.1 prephenate dehydrogenase/arogenate dehydrogenase family protein [Natronomonas aquatica]
MQLLVVGAGEMGRWFARESGAGTVAFADRDPETAREAAAAIAGSRAVPLDTDETFDVVCHAVPMSSTPAAIEAHAGKATGAVVDVAGEMRDSVAALESHAESRACASFHPLFSASNAPGNVPSVVVRDGPAIGRLRSALEAAGNEVFETTVEEHDRAMETVQAKAHTAVLAYALAAEEIDPRFQTAFSEPLSELVERLTGDTPEVYAEIQARFDGSTPVADAAAEIAAADAETFVELYEEAGE